MEQSPKPISDQPAKLKGLDCVNNPRDLGMVSEAMRRWPKRWRAHTEAMKAAVVQDVDAGRRAAREILDNAAEPDTALAAADRIFTAARVHAMIEGQDQADDHLAEKYARIDEGKATDAVTPIVYKGVDAGDV